MRANRREQLERYEHRLRDRIKAASNLIESLNEDLVMQAKFQITDLPGEQQIRDDIAFNQRVIVEAQTYLKIVEAELAR